MRSKVYGRVDQYDVRASHVQIMFAEVGVRIGGHGRRVNPKSEVVTPEVTDAKMLATPLVQVFASHTSPPTLRIKSNLKPNEQTEHEHLS